MDDARRGTTYALDAADVPPPFVPAELCAAPFTVAQARAAGLSHSALRSTQWRRLFRGVWAHVDLPDTRETRVASARLALPPYAVLRGLTAAWIYGADVRRADDLDVHVYLPAGGQVRPRPGVIARETTLAEGDVWCVGDVPVTSPTRTVFDCLRTLSETEAVVAADAMTCLRRTTVEDVAAYIAVRRRVRGCRIAESRLVLVEPRTESPMETRLRVLLHRAQLPSPQPQWVVRAPDGRFVARLDFAWPRHCVALEYDGADHWQQRRRDDRRRAATRELGWHVDVVSAEDFYDAPGEIVAMTERALRAAATRPNFR